MIPKIIHYCWFGGNPLPELAVKCIESWKKYCPDYQIIQWNEDNYDIKHSCLFVNQAYQNKKWAFVSDYARLDVVNQYGGIYLDTDVELLAPLNSVMKDCKGWFAFEKENVIASGLGFASESDSKLLRDMMECYHHLSFDIGRMSEMSCPIINTKVLVEYGAKANNQLQIVGGYKLLPTDYMCPQNFFTGKTHYTHNTISIHHYNNSWMDEEERRRTERIIRMKRLLPEWVVQLLRKLISHAC